MVILREFIPPELSVSLYNAFMKNKTFRITVIVLLTVLVISTSLCGFVLYQFATAARSMGEEIGQAMEEQTSAEVGEQDGVMAFYSALFEQLSKYGNLEETGEKSAELLTTVFEKTLKYCTVKNISYQEDGIILDVEGVCVPADKINAGLVAGAAGKAAVSYVGNNLFEVGTSLFQGMDGIKKSLYGGYANELITQLNKEIAAMPNEPSRYRLRVSNQNGKWEISTLKAAENSSNEESTPAAEQNSSQPEADPAG